VRKNKFIYFSALYSSSYCRCTTGEDFSEGRRRRKLRENTPIKETIQKYSENYAKR
jgi:acetone carboxylase gamma subunit